jgi:hypothetical protein
VISILALLNFGSGYRIPLHAATGRGAWDSILALIFSLYLTSSVGDDGDLLSTKGIQNITDYKVAELMNVSQYSEAPHETIPGVTVGKQEGPMYDLVKLITETLNETGTTLANMGYPNLGTFVVEALRDSEKADVPNAQADFVVERVSLMK